MLARTDLQIFQQPAILRALEVHLTHDPNDIFHLKLIEMPSQRRTCKAAISLTEAWPACVV